MMAPTAEPVVLTAAPVTLAAVPTAALVTVMTVQLAMRVIVARRVKYRMNFIDAGFSNFEPWGYSNLIEFELIS